MNRSTTRRGFITRIAAMAAVGPFVKLADGTFVEPTTLRALETPQRAPLPVVTEPRLFVVAHDHEDYALITYDCVGDVEVSLDGAPFKPGPRDHAVFVRRGQRDRIVRLKASIGSRTARSSWVVEARNIDRPRTLV